jgi:hypothetical protein
MVKASNFFANNAVATVRGNAFVTVLLMPCYYLVTPIYNRATALENRILIPSLLGLLAASMWAGVLSPSFKYYYYYYYYYIIIINHEYKISPLHTTCLPKQDGFPYKMAII